MSCRPPCCKRDPERQCPICFTDQTWKMEVPSPIEFYTPITDKLVDGSGDASVGTCGGASGRDGSDGFDSHTYLDSSQKGSEFDSELEGTTTGDLLPRPALWRDTGVCNQLIGGRIYGVTQFPKSTPSEVVSKAAKVLPKSPPVKVSGQFYIPSSPIISGVYTKTLQIRFGGDRGGPDELWDKTLAPDFAPSIETAYGTLGLEFIPLATWGFSFTGGVSENLVFVGQPVSGERQVQNGDNVTNDEYSLKSLNDRRVFMQIFIQGEGLRLYDTDLTVGDYLNGGVLLRVKVTQTSVEAQPEEGDFLVGVDVEYTIPESQFLFSKSISSNHSRCDNGYASLASKGSRKKSYLLPTSGPFEYVYPESASPGWRLANQDPAWWINELNSFTPVDDRKFLFILPWISEFEVSDGDFSDTANFLVERFVHRDSGGEIKQIAHAADYSGLTIPDGTEINIGEVETGDTFELDLDNLGEVTTEVSAVTFDTPFISTVDDSTPTLLPYDYQTISFTTSAATTGSSDIVLTHDKNNLIIPSPWTLTLTTQEGPIDGGPGEGGPPE